MERSNEIKNISEVNLNQTVLNLWKEKLRKKGDKIPKKIQKKNEGKSQKIWKNVIKSQKKEMKKVEKSNEI